MKRLSASKLFWGVIFILSAVLIVLDAIGAEMGFLNGIPVFRSIIVLLLVSVAVEQLIKRDFGGVFFPLAAAFMIYEAQIAKWLSLESSNIISNWLVLVVALLLTVGCYLLFGKKRSFSFEYNSDNKRHKIAGSSVKNIDCTCFNHMTVENELGSCEIHFSNVESYTGNGVLTVNNELGSMQIYVPREWTVTEHISNSLGSVRTVGDSNGTGKTLIINGENELGSIAIEYV